jgi:hypothetical protein
MQSATAGLSINRTRKYRTAGAGLAQRLPFGLRSGARIQSPAPRINSRNCHKSRKGWPAGNTGSPPPDSAPSNRETWPGADGDREGQSRFNNFHGPTRPGLCAGAFLWAQLAEKWNDGRRNTA